MTTINCIAIEDEPHASQLLEHYAGKLPFLRWAGSFRQPLEALPMLNTKQVDLLFLDINLAQMNGITFYRSLAHKPHVIFTTAYAEYALESYSIEALDYLVKPILFERFVQACSKAQRSISHPSIPASAAAEKPEALYLKSGAKWFQLQWTDICHLEKSENYVIFHTLDGRKILSRQTMADVEQIIPPFFCRIHKSFIINLQRVEVIERERVIVNGQPVTLADSYRESFMKKCGLLKT